MASFSCKLELALAGAMASRSCSKLGWRAILSSEVCNPTLGIADDLLPTSSHWNSMAYISVPFDFKPLATSHSATLSMSCRHSDLWGST